VVVTADRAATTTTLRRPSGAGGGRSELSEESGFAEMVDSAVIQSALTSCMIVFKREFCCLFAVGF